MQFVYILKCANQTYYVGCTKNLKDRLKRHSASEVNSTKNRLPIKLITVTIFANKYIAYNFEKYLKSGSGRAFMIRHLI